MKRKTAGAAFAITLLLALGGCNEEERHVPPNLQRQLPTHQYALTDDLCPFEPVPARLRRKGRAEFAALLGALRRDPEVIVDSTYTPSDGPIEHEDISLRELAETHLEGLDAEGEACGDRAARRLEAVLED